MKSELEKFTAVKKIYHSDANFILFEIANNKQLYLNMADKGVVCRYRGTETHCHDCLRVTVGTREENVAFMDLLKRGERCFKLGVEKRVTVFQSTTIKGKTLYICPLYKKTRRSLTAIIMHDIHVDRGVAQREIAPLPYHNPCPSSPEPELGLFRQYTTSAGGTLLYNDAIY